MITLGKNGLLRFFGVILGLEWPILIVNILHRNLSGGNGIVVRRSSQNSDLCITLPFFKKKLKTILFNKESLGKNMEWVAEKLGLSIACQYIISVPLTLPTVVLTLQQLLLLFRLER